MEEPALRKRSTQPVDCGRGHANEPSGTPGQSSVRVGLALAADHEVLVRDLLENIFDLTPVSLDDADFLVGSSRRCVLLSGEAALDALSLLRSARSQPWFKRCTIIVIGDGSDANLAASVFKAGGQDYLSIDTLDRGLLKEAILTAVQRKGEVELLDRVADENAHLAAIIASSSDGIVSLGADGATVTTWSPGAIILFGYTESEAVGRTIDELIIPPNKRDERDDLHRRVRDINRPIIVETERLHKSGHLIAVEINVSPILSDGPRATGFSVIFRDIRERREAERTVREARDRLARREADLTRAQRIARIGSYEVECKDIVFVNRRSPEYLNIHGLPPEDWNEPHEAWVQRIHPADRKRSEAEFKKAVRDGSLEYVTEYRIIRPSDGELRWIKVLAEIDRDPTGQAMRLFGTHVDITEQKIAEEALRASEAQLRLALQAAHLGLFEIDWKTRRGLWSPELRAMLAVPEKQDLSDDCDLLSRIIPRDQLENFRARQRGWFDPETGADHEDEHEVIRFDGSRGHVLLRGRTLFEDTNDGSQPIRTVGLMMDITERKRAESQRELLLRELDHRLKNIFASVSSMITLSVRSATDVESYATALRERIFALTAVHSLVRTVDSGASASLSLIAKTVATRGFEDKIHVSGPDIALNADCAVAFGMILNELLTNAIKYGALSRENGEVHINWSAIENRLSLSWIESGGPAVTPNGRVGFGTRMIEQSAAAIGGKLDKRWGPGGLRVTIDCPL